MHSELGHYTLCRCLASSIRAQALCKLTMWGLIGGRVSILADKGKLLGVREATVWWAPLWAQTHCWHLPPKDSSHRALCSSIPVGKVLHRFIPNWQFLTVMMKSDWVGYHGVCWCFCPKILQIIKQVYNPRFNHRHQKYQLIRIQSQFQVAFRLWTSPKGFIPKRTTKL